MHCVQKANSTETLAVALIAACAVLIGFGQLKGAFIKPVVAATAAPAQTTFPTTPAQLANMAKNQKPQLQQSYGLIQTGIVGVSQMDATGQFSNPQPMPVYQVIRVQAPTQSAMHGQTMPSTSPATPSYPAQAMGPKQCMVNGVVVLTDSQDACAKAGGQVATQ